MVYISIEQRKQQKKQNLNFIKKIITDINSNKSYSEKKYLQQFNKIIENDKRINNCNNENNLGYDFFTNYHGSNNVHISGLSNSNYYGHCTPSLF